LVGTVTDSGGDPERSLTRDEMLDDITLYWLTNTTVSSARLYWENRKGSLLRAGAAAGLVCAVFRFGLEAADRGHRGGAADGGQGRKHVPASGVDAGSTPNSL